MALGRGLDALLGDTTLQAQTGGSVNLPISQVEPGLNQPRKHFDEEALADLADNDAYWASWEGPAEQVGSAVYEGFLQSYGQELGMRSYGACVDLLVEKYLPLAQQGA